MLNIIYQPKNLSAKVWPNIFRPRFTVHVHTSVRFQLESNYQITVVFKLFYFQVLENLDMNHLRLLLEISKVSVIFILPFWIYYDYLDVMKMTSLVSIFSVFLLL